jgi:hypothetical protein
MFLVCRSIVAFLVCIRNKMNFLFSNELLVRFIDLRMSSLKRVVFVRVYQCRIKFENFELIVSIYTRYGVLNVVI